MEMTCNENSPFLNPAKRLFLVQTFLDVSKRTPHKESLTLRIQVVSGIPEGIQLDLKDLEEKAVSNQALCSLRLSLFSL
jgi:hypothetical protein